MSDADALGRWRIIEALVDAALDRVAHERAAYVRMHAPDARTAEEVLRIIAAGEGGSSLLDQPAASFAAPLLAGPDVATAADGQPDMVGPYRIVRQIGAGGMGTVFLVERADGHFRKQLALKLVRRGLHSEPRLLQRFSEERHILARIDHANVARLLDAGVTPDGVPFYVMEYVEGIPLDRYCDSLGLGIGERLRLFCLLCEAVAAAHALGIVHRDLKPNNILVSRDGQPKLLDFGIARLVQAQGADGGITRTGERLLTPEYASPEQVRGEDATPASDVHALGVLLHELLAGSRPFAVAGTPHELEQAILRAEPQLMSRSVAGQADGGAHAASLRNTSAARLRSLLRGDLDAVAAKALRKAPGERYPDAAALLLDLRRCLAGEAPSARAGQRFHAMRTILRRHRLSASTAAAGMAAGVALFALLGGTESGVREAGRDEPVIAVGRIEDYRGADADSPDPLTEMLATGLARTAGLRVVSAALMAELLRGGGEGTADAHIAAACRAGANELVDGVLYATADGQLRLDLRRTDIMSGTIRAAYTVTGADLFALADSGAIRLASGLGFLPPRGSVADVTTHSVAAYRMYAQGLREFHRGDRALSERLFDAALQEDSTFAMAAYYHALSSTAGRAETSRRLARADVLARHASDLERLVIQASRARFSNAPSLRAVADSIVAAFPDAVEGHFFRGIAGLQAGDLDVAVPALNRVIELDTLGRRVAFAECAACLAYGELVAVYLHADSFAAAVRVGEHGVRRLPDQPAVWSAYGRALGHAGRFDDAVKAVRKQAQLLPGGGLLPGAERWVWLMAERFDSADPLLKEQLRLPDPAERSRARAFLALSLRAQGRLREAMDVAREIRGNTAAPRQHRAAPPDALMEALLRSDLGGPRAGAALHDSITRWPFTQQDTSVWALGRIWAHAELATMAALDADTAAVVRAAREIGALLPLSGSMYAGVLLDYVRGLHHATRGDEASAVAAYRAALRDPALGYTRINLALADLHLRNGRAHDAVAALQPVLRGAYGTANSYVSRTEAHEKLALAFDAAARPDSALVHWQAVVRNWSRADPELQPRVARAADRVAALQRRP